MFGRVAKVNNNYYISPHGEEYLHKKAVAASIIAGAAFALFLPALILWLAFDLKSLLWIFESDIARSAYMLVFICAALGLVICFVLSFFGYKIRKKVTQKSGPTLGFRRSSYNGAFFTAVLVSALFLFQIVILIGYHIAANTGYIAEVIARNQLDKTVGFDAIGVVIAVLYAFSAAASWLYYFFTFRVNRTMQLVTPDKTEPADAPAIPTKEEAEKHRPDRDEDYTPPRPTYGLTEEEKKTGENEFVNDDKN